MHELTFAQRKIRAFLAATTAEMFIGTLLNLSDSVIAGHIIGPDSLSAINLIMPYYVVALFLGEVTASGSAMVYAMEFGKLRGEKAYAAFGQGLLTAAVAGVLMLLTGLFSLPFELQLLDAFPEIADLTRRYMHYYIFVLLLSPLNVLLSRMVYADGGEICGSAAAIILGLTNVVSSLVLGTYFGIEGIAMGTVLSYLVSLAILSIHFFSRRNSLKIRFRPSLRLQWKIIYLGVGSDLMFLYLALLTMICNQTVTLLFGAEYLPVLTVLYGVIELSVVLESAGEAIRPMIGIYRGAKNPPAIRSIMQYTARLNLYIGIALSFVVFLAAPYIPFLFQLGDHPELYSICINGLRIYALAFPPLSWLALYDSYWLFIDKRGMSMLSNTLKYFLCAAILAPILSKTLGMKGLWLGFAIAPLMSYIIVRAWGLFRYGRKQFPLLLPEQDSAAADFSLPLEQPRILQLLRDIESFLRSQNVEWATIARMLQLTEDLLLLIAEKNPGNRIYAECCLNVTGEKVSLSIWDSGKPNNITNSDTPVSQFRSYVVSRLLDGTASRKQYLLSVGFNRSVIEFNRTKAEQT